MSLAGFEPATLPSKQNALSNCAIETSIAGAVFEFTYKAIIRSMSIIHVKSFESKRHFRKKFLKCLTSREITQIPN